MIVRLFVIAVVWSLLFALAACSPDPSGKTLSFDASEKVCQLTGDTDWETRQATTTQTGRFGLSHTDLGYPVEHQGQLALLFGDSRSPSEQILERNLNPPDDAIGWITSHAVPTAEQCTDLTINSTGNARLLHPHVVGQLPVQHGLFNVPTGGVSEGGWLYAFFWTHCTSPPVPCPENDVLNSIGHGVLARSNDKGVNFIDPVLTPPGFVYATAVDATAIQNLPAEQKLGTYIFAVPKYRESVPYLAYAAPGELGDPSRWNFMIERKPDGQPVWTSYDVWHCGPTNAYVFSPPGHPDLFPATGADRCVGEFSVTWNQGLGVWLMLYNCTVENRPRALSRAWRPRLGVRGQSQSLS